jgi:hypothetical protein
MDELSLAFIEFNDVNKWFSENGIDLGIPIKAFDEEDRVLQVMNK